VVEKDDFVTMCKATPAILQSDALTAFEVFDTHQNGYIPLKELL
jgi:Ca2+-binding EF-hand superfamily protein